MATRIAYALILLVNSIISWIMLTDWAVKKLQHVLLDYVDITCNGGACYGFVFVQRVNFALGIFHAVLAICLVGVNNSRNSRSSIQNGFWGPKIVAWLGLIVVTFFIPDQFFLVWGKYVAVFGATLFLLLGLVLLVDLAHTIAEYCVAKIQEPDSARIWSILIVGGTIGMYLSSLAMTIVMYIFFANKGCSMNQSAITINLTLLTLVSGLSVHPIIQETNTRSGLVQSATVGVYCTYLTLSAVGMEPDDQHCNPLVRARGTRKASIILGAIITFLTVAYTTTRAATYGLALGGAARNSGHIKLDDEEGGDHSLDTAAVQPQSRREMRQEALLAAVNSGALPASALDDSDSDDEDEPSRKHGKDDERDATQYNYSMFHIVFLLSTMWIASLLTTQLEDHKGNDFVAVGRTYWASWVKIVSAWVCYGIYAWSLAAPVLLPERFDY